MKRLLVVFVVLAGLIGQTQSGLANPNWFDPFSDSPKIQIIVSMSVAMSIPYRLIEKDERPDVIRFSDISEYKYQTYCWDCRPGVNQYVPELNQIWLADDSKLIDLAINLCLFIRYRNGDVRAGDLGQSWVRSECGMISRHVVHKYVDSVNNTPILPF